MGKLLFIDSDDVNGLSEALRNALERRGVVFKQDYTGEFDYPTDDDDIPDIDPYFGVMPNSRQYTPSQYGGCGSVQGRGFGACGGRITTYKPIYKHC